jgi:hypothetical protein
VPARYVVLRRAISVIAGVAAALACCELALRPFATPYGPPQPDPAADRLDAPALTVRELDEGVGTAHFSFAGARLTGNPRIANAPTVLVLGDSYVTAREVADAVTMGAQLERLARQSAYPINVRQYGWPGATPARYLLEADRLLTRWRPARVIIVLSENDLNASALIDGPPLRVDSSGFAEIAGPDDLKRGSERRVSSLATLAALRWWDIEVHAPRWVSHKTNPAVAALGSWAGDSTELAALPHAVVRSLRRSYGGALGIVYLAEARTWRHDSLDVFEQRLLAGCRAERVPCVSTRDAMNAAQRSGTITHGFRTTRFDVGHLNAAGHALVADIMWRMIRTESGPRASRAN